MLVSNLSLAQKQAPAPLFIDPNYHGSCDPEIIFNSADSYWYIYYTSRRSLIEQNFVATPIGVIRSKDFMKWEFVNYCSFDGVGGKKDMPSTFWAPAIIEKDGLLHMFVTWKPDTTMENGAWGGPAKIVHYQCDLANPVDGWKKVADMHGSELDALDATVFETNGVFHLWFKGKKTGENRNKLYHLTSPDLFIWSDGGTANGDVFKQEITKERFEEAPYVFYWKENYWLLTDTHQGMLVYKSKNGENWKYQNKIMKEGSSRNLDNNAARHCCVAVLGERAYIFYHVEPWRDYEGIRIFNQPIENRRAVLQMAELVMGEDGLISSER